ncbi:MAG: hypothetical protein ABWZ79_10825 [Pedobacter agri]
MSPWCIGVNFPRKWINSRLLIT